MAKSISLCDTHRTPYANATLRAYKLADGTTQIKFKAGKNSSPEYFEVRTNSRGYLCDTNGNIYSVGIFVEEDALIKCTLPDGNVTTWQVCVDDDTPINDGKLLGLRTPTSEDDDVEEKWSANSPNDHVLNYNELTNRPAINEWMEVEQIVTMEQNIDTVNVDKFAKTITVQTDGNCAPEGWEKDSNGNYVADVSVERNGTWQLKLIPSDDRVAQVICIRNHTPWRLKLVSVTGDTICVLNAWAGQENDGKLVCLYGLFDRRYHQAPSLEKFNVSHSYVLDETLTDEHNAVHPLVIDDYTPDTMFIGVSPQYPWLSTLNGIYVKCQDIQRPRRITLWLQNTLDSALNLYDTTSGSSALVGIMPNNAIFDVEVNANGVVKVSDTLPQVLNSLQTLQISQLTQSYELEPNKKIVNGIAFNGGTVIDSKNDLFSEKMIYFRVKNTGNTVTKLTYKINGSPQAIVDLIPENAFGELNGGFNNFVIHKLGGSAVVLYPQAANKNDRYLKFDDDHFDYKTIDDRPCICAKLVKTAQSQDTVRVNIPYLYATANNTGVTDNLAWGAWGFNNQGCGIVFDVHELLGEQESITLYFEIDPLCKVSDGPYKFGRCNLFFTADENYASHSPTNVNITENDEETHDPASFTVYAKKYKVELSRALGNTFNANVTIVNTVD